MLESLLHAVENHLVEVLGLLSLVEAAAYSENSRATEKACSVVCSCPRASSSKSKERSEDITSVWCLLIAKFSIVFDRLVAIVLCKCRHRFHKNKKRLFISSESPETMNCIKQETKKPLVTVGPKRMRGKGILSSLGMVLLEVPHTQT